MVITDVEDIEVERARIAVASVPDPEIPVVTIADLGILQFENWADPFADTEQSPTGATSARF